jgi:ABC-type transport system involved in multi-copper enzyme maturation permease subunit
MSMRHPYTSPLLTVARFTLVEARRSALPWLSLACVLAAIGIAGFLAQVAITESTAIQSSVSAALLRACAIFLVAAHVAASVVRETNDKILELSLALPIPRSTWYLGKLAGFAATAALIAAAFALPLLFWARPGDIFVWWLAVAGEAAVIAAAALFFASALGQTVAAMAATLGLYLLARSIGAVQAIAGSSGVDGTTGRLAHWLVEALAFLLPRLEGAAQGDWLLYGAPAAADLGALLTGLVIYLALLAAAGLFDFSRRNL